MMKLNAFVQAFVIITTSILMTTIIGQRFRGYIENKCQMDWSYKDSQSWPETYPSCGGWSQSPINIDTKSIPNIKYNFNLNLDGYMKKIDRVTLENTGHTIKVSTNRTILVFGGPAGRDSFKLDEFHFHFGKHDGFNGTEHTVNLARAAMEIHLVHVNTKYRNIEEARRHEDGLLVIAIFANLDKYSKQERRLSFVTDNLDKIKRPSKILVRGPIDLSSLLPPRKLGFSYWTYNGSLTTPPCSEAVIWVLGTNTLSINTRQLKLFRSVLDQCDRQIAGNIRPIQATNGREIGYVTA